MPRATWIILAPLLAAVCATDGALAHGARFVVGYQARQGEVPNPAPAHGGQPPPAPPVWMPDTARPVPASTTGIPVTPSSTGRAPARGPAASDADWPIWYAHNREPIENLKDAIYHVVSSDHLGALGGSQRAVRTDSTHAMRQAVEAHAVPALLWAMDPKNARDPDVEAAAYIGLAKIAKDWAHIEQLQHGLDRGHDPLTEESSALAMGLLRRTDPESQLPAGDLDRVRAKLFSVFEDDSFPTRTRAFAGFALGLLGDQPTRIARVVTTRLVGLLEVAYPNEELPVALLVALGMQSPTTFTETELEVLRGAVLKGRLQRRDASSIARAWCAHVLGRVGNASDVTVLQRALTLRNGDAQLERSAVIALGELAERIDSDERASLIADLLPSLRRLRDVATRSFGWIAIGKAIARDSDQDRTTVMDETDAETVLLEAAEKRRGVEQPFAALALGIACRAIGEEATNGTTGAWRVKCLERLRAGLADKRLEAKDRGAFAVALGIARDRRGARALADVVSDDALDASLRGYAAVGLGLIGDASPAHREAIRSALRERRSEEMRVHCATALALLHDRDAVPLLLEELDEARSQSVKGHLVLALARIGDERAVAPLVALLKSEQEQDLTRALACAGLGIVGDLDPAPSLARLRNGSNYRSSTPALAEAMTIL